MRRTRVCCHIDASTGRTCPNLQPCPDHPPRPRNASWSPGRDRAAQARDRRAQLERAGYTCQRCGRHDPTGRALDLHHITPTETVVLCSPCHCAVDPHARRRPTT